MPLPAPVPPVTPAVVQQGFAPAPHAWLPAHRGVDLRAGAGQSVRAVRAGTVVFADRIADRGVLVLRSRGVRFTFEPVRATVPVGSIVGAGERIGVVDVGGHCDGSCLHWGAKRDGVYLDPAIFLPRRAPVLKPPR
jgi:murein DD-endopeptidase MepM/ murein hydrolase activator NlpD